MTASILLAHLRALVRARMQAGESLPKIGAAAGIKFGTLRQWVYQSTSGDAATLEDAIARLGGGTIEIPGATP